MSPQQFVHLAVLDARPYFDAFGRQGLLCREIVQEFVDEKLREAADRGIENPSLKDDLTRHLLQEAGVQ